MEKKKNNDDFEEYKFVEEMDEDDAKVVLESGYQNAEKLLKEPDKVEELLDRLELKLKVIPKLGGLLSNIPVMIAMVRDFIHKKYDKAPLGTIIAIVSALIYVLNPFDIIPDVIPGVGQIDDVLVVSACISLIGSDIEEYQEWKKEN